MNSIRFWQDKPDVTPSSSRTFSADALQMLSGSEPWKQVFTAENVPRIGNWKTSAGIVPVKSLKEKSIAVSISWLDTLKRLPGWPVRKFLADRTTCNPDMSPMEEGKVPVK